MTRMTRSRLVLVMAAFMSLMVLGALASCGCGNGESKGASRVTDYRVLEVGHGLDEPFYKIVVEPGATPDELKAICQTLIAKAEHGPPFTFMWLTFYDYPQLANYAGPSLGWARFGGPETYGWTRPSPHGPTPAPAVSPGDYRAMTLETHLLAKDWALRPSQEAVNVWSYWQQLVYRRGHLTGEQRLRLVARRFQITVNQVLDDAGAVNDWVTPSIGRIW